jgi:hypothetical protein
VSWLKVLDYAARFLKKCNEICRIFMQFYAMKLRELAKTTATTSVALQK